MAYSIAGNDFSTYNMQVISSLGALNFPGRLGDIDHDWNDENGVDAYVLSSDLHWDGREITLLIWYSGNNLNTDLATFRGLYEGQSVSLVTTYGTHTATLQEIIAREIYETNKKAILNMKFWEPVVSVPSVPTPVGGSGITLGSYDFLNDFGLHVQGLNGLYDFRYREEVLTYGEAPEQISGYRGNRKINILLNGHYSSLSNLTGNINDLHAVLRSSGLKTLGYNGISEDVYFADKSTVTVIINALIAIVRLTLRISE